MRDATAAMTHPGDITKRLVEVLPGRVFRHYKGPTYTIIGLAHMHDSRVVHVIYASHEKQTINLRPRHEFVENVKLHDDSVVPRFRWVGPVTP